MTLTYEKLKASMDKSPSGKVLQPLAGQVPAGDLSFEKRPDGIVAKLGSAEISAELVKLAFDTKEEPIKFIVTQLLRDA